MESSRKTILTAIALLFVSQFFQYGATGHTTGTIDLTRHLISGLLPYGGETGWELHAWWFYVPLTALVAYLFYSSPRGLTIYWISLALFILMGLGSGTGGILGGISIVLYGLAVYRKIKENNVRKASAISNDAPHFHQSSTDNLSR